jgi:hypothetical protein
MSRIFRVSAGQNFLTGGGKLQFPTEFLPILNRVEALFIEISAVVDVPAAGLTSEQATMLVDLVECERRVRTTGLGIDGEDWLLNGKDVTRPAALAVGNGQALELFYPLSYRDPRGVEPMDGALPVEFIRGKTVDVHLKRPSDILAGLAVQSGTVQLVAFLSPMPAGGVIPTSIVTNYVEVIGKEVKIPRGRIVDAFIRKNDGSTITDAEMGNMSLTRDGSVNIFERARTKQLARQFNYFCAKGAQAQGAADGVEGEAFPNDGSLPLVPLVSQLPGYKATKLHAVQDALTLTFDGTLAPNTARCYFRIIEEADEVTTVKAATKLGMELDAEATIEGKTASKNGVHSDVPFRKVNGVIPRRIRGARMKA